MAADRLGVGIGWRPEIDLTIARLPEVEWVEVVAENLRPDRLPEQLTDLRRRGIPVLPHGVSLSLGGAEPLRMAAAERLAALTAALDAPLASDHVCFVRAGGLDSGHLVPVPRTRAALDVLADNIIRIQSLLDVPFAVENIAALLEWPDAEFTEARFLAELTERTGCLLILDVANLYANARNLGVDPIAFLDDIPLDRVAYAHVAGGVQADGRYHDTHAHPVPADVLDLLAELAGRTTLPGVLLERDDDFPSDAELAAELAAVAKILAAACSDPAPPRRNFAADPDRHRDAAVSRAEQAARQGALLRALLTDGPPPPGLAADQLASAAMALRAKRARVVAQLRPDVRHALGDRYPALFADYAAAHPKTTEQRARGDADAFAAWLLARGALPAPAPPPRRRRFRLRH